MPLSTPPVVRAQMLIRKPVADVFAAFVDPAITTKFWFTRSTGRVEAGATLTWSWEMYGASGQVKVIAVEPNRRIAIEWPLPVEWTFTPQGEAATMVHIVASGFAGTDDEQLAQALDSSGGFNLLLAGCKAYLEHGLALNLVGDHHPEAHVKSG